MKRSSVVSLIESLGFDPSDVGYIVLRLDEVEVRQKNPGHGIWFVQEDDYPVADTFDEVLANINLTAPIQLDDVVFIRWDWRGGTVAVGNGLSWSIPWEDENE